MAVYTAQTRSNHVAIPTASARQDFCVLTFTVSSRAAAIGGIGALGLGVGGYVLVNHCLFNVEGGHRAVMYSRLSGMSPVVRGEVTEPCTREVTGRGSVAHAQVAHDRAGRLRR